MPNLTYIPRQRRGHHLQEVAGETVVYGRSSMRSFFLNETASAVWKLCDGTRSVQEIIDVLAEAYPDSGAEIAVDVAQVINQLAADGLIAVEEPRTA